MKKKRVKIRFIIILIIIFLIGFSYFTYTKIDNYDKNEDMLALNLNLLTNDFENIDDILSGQLEDKYIYNSLSEDINLVVQVQPHIDNSTGEKYITYEDFGARSDEQFDCYNCIKNAHDYANKYNYAVRATLDTYHIYKLNEMNPIIIKTNTNWNNATFVIHDENISNLQTRNYSIFQISSNEKDITITDKEVLNNIKLNKQTTKIDELSGNGNCLCIVYNENKHQFIRSGSNENGGNPQTDLFKIDNDGNIINDIQWDFDQITKIVLKPIPDEQIIIENGNFKTILPDEDYEQSSGYYNRNITCNRSNTILRNIKHELSNDEIVGGPYYGFIKLINVSDVQLYNLHLVSHKYIAKSNYDLILEYCTNIFLDNIVSDNIDDTNRWGITGTNYTKDINYQNCILNRIDAHCGVYNLNIDNCTIGIKGLTLTGAGELNIDNSTRVGGATFIELRSDYGSSWNGTVNVKDCKFITDQANTIFYFAVLYESDRTPHYYGYDRVLPNLNINNLQIEENSTNSSLMYIFYNNAYYTGNEIGDLFKAGYIMPEYLTINNYSINTGKRIKAFYQDFTGSEQIDVNINIPDRPKLQMTNEDGSQYENGKLTNDSISLKLSSVKNVADEIFINNEKINGNDILITGSGYYNISVKATDIAGNTAQDDYIVNIDKDGPKITGVENGQVYYNSVTPNITDSNLVGQVVLYLNDNIVNSYEINDSISEYGLYELEATDSLGNTSVINFEIADDNIEDIIKQYTITKNKYIKGILNNTTVDLFFENAGISTSFKIFNGDKQLNGSDIISTGDKLKVNNKEFVLIVEGDTNCDGNTNIMDLMIVQRAIIKDSVLEDNIKEAADINNDNNINIIDVMNIIRIVISN